MPDMLVKLYALPELAPVMASQAQQGVVIRRALAPEQSFVADWVRDHFSNAWASETTVSFARQPLSCYIAVAEGQVLGFACYDSILKGFFGPTGVDESQRGRGIGAALLLACLHAMRHEGYGYAIIGAAGPTGFYERIVGATVIPDSAPGIYRGILKVD